MFTGVAAVSGPQSPVLRLGRSILPLGTLFFALLLSAPRALADESLVSIGDRTYLTRENAQGKITYLRYPTLGCPALVVRGTTGTALVRIPDGGGTDDFQLSLTPTADPTPRTFELITEQVSYDADLQLYRVTYRVPAAVPKDTYDFQVVVPSRSVSDRQFNACKVMERESNQFTFVVLADPQFNDPRGLFSPKNLAEATFDNRSTIEEMKREVRALNPDFAVLCGDVLFGLDYDMEYEAGWKVWKDAGFPVFMVPGNHDGFTSTQERSVLGIKTKVYDGLEYWQRYFGPQYYSFDWGGVHFQGINSYDGTVERRDGFLVVTMNQGGDLGEEQMKWIEGDLKRTTRTVVPFLHHSPIGPYTPNVLGVTAFDWLMRAATSYLATGRVEDLLQVWNSASTAEFLKLQYHGRSKLALVGHQHRDSLTWYNGTLYKHVTHLASAGDGYWGYAVVRMEDGQAVDHLYRGEEMQSVPTGNLRIRYLTGNTGTKTEEKAEIRCGLGREYDITLEFTLPKAAGYVATPGSVVATSDIDEAKTKVWVKLRTPAVPNLLYPTVMNVSVRAEAMAVIDAPTLPPVPQNAVAASSESVRAPGSRGKKFFCAAGPGGSSAGEFLLLLALLSAARLFRRRLP